MELSKSSGEEQLSKDVFMKWFGQDETDRHHQTGIEDILKPLITVLKRKGYTISTIFDKYDTNRSDTMSASELQYAVKDLFEYEINNEEV